MDDMIQQSISDDIDWSSHRFKSPVWSTAAAEILATGEAIDDGRMLATTLHRIYGANIPLCVAVDSKDLFNSVSTQWNNIDR